MTTADAPPVTISSAPQGSDWEGPSSWETATSRLPALRPVSPVPTYLGIAVAVLGFVVILIGWGGAAGETNVARQVPYLLSGGLVGLGLVVIGATVVNVAAKRRDAALRERQTALLADAISELSRALSR